MREKDGRRFFLKNTAPNLAGAELQELVRAAIESNGGRITTSQNQAPEATTAGSSRSRSTCSSSRRRRRLQKILHALETQLPYLVVDNLTLRPLNAFRGFQPAPGQEPEINVQLDVVGVRVRRAAEDPPSPQVNGGRDERRLQPALRAVALVARCRSPSRSRCIGVGNRLGRARAHAARADAADRAEAGGRRRCCPNTRSRAAPPRARTPSSARCSTRRAGRRRSAVAEAAKPRMQRGQFALTGTMVVDGKSTAFLREVAGGKSRRVQQGETINGMLVAEVKPDRVRLTLGDESEELVLKVATNPQADGPAGGAGAPRRHRGRRRQRPRRSRSRRPRQPAGSAPSVARRAAPRRARGAGGQRRRRPRRRGGNAAAAAPNANVAGARAGRRRRQPAPAAPAAGSADQRSDPRRLDVVSPEPTRSPSVAG